MKYKNKMLGCLHKLYRGDPWIGVLFDTVGLTLDNWVDVIADMANQPFFDTVAGPDLRKYEIELGIRPEVSASLQDRRAAAEAKWKSSGKADIYLLQAVADSWKNGVIDISFIDGKIKIAFVGEYGIPTDLYGLEKAIDQVKPAHLAIYYVFKYYLIKDIHSVLTLAELEQQKLNRFAGGEL